MCYFPYIRNYSIPNWRPHIYQRGRNIPPTSICMNAVPKTTENLRLSYKLNPESSKLGLFWYWKPWSVEPQGPRIRHFFASLVHQVDVKLVQYVKLELGLSWHWILEASLPWWDWSTLCHGAVELPSWCSFIWRLELVEDHHPSAQQPLNLMSAFLFREHFRDNLVTYSHLQNIPFGEKVLTQVKSCEIQPNLL